MLNPEWSGLKITGPGIYRTSEGRRVTVREHDPKNAPPSIPQDALAAIEAEKQKADSPDAAPVRSEGGGSSSQDVH